MLAPNRPKFRKRQKGSSSGMSKRGCFVDFGDYGMQVLARGWITSQQIEACRIAMTRHLGRKVKVWIRIFPDKPVTAKPAETRMGKGKGVVSGWVTVVRPGRVLFEVANVSEEEAKRFLRKASPKLPVKTRVVKRRHRV